MGIESMLLWDVVITGVAHSRQIRDKVYERYKKVKSLRDSTAADESGLIRNILKMQSMGNIDEFAEKVYDEIN